MLSPPLLLLRLSLSFPRVYELMFSHVALLTSLPYRSAYPPLLASLPVADNVVWTPRSCRKPDHMPVAMLRLATCPPNAFAALARAPMPPAALLRTCRRFLAASKGRKFLFRRWACAGILFSLFCGGGAMVCDCLPFPLVFR